MSDLTAPPVPPPDAVTVRVPATTSNLGPGFDCLGVALRLANHLRLWRRPGGEPPAGSGTHPMAAAVAAAFFARAGTPPFAFDWELGGEVPVSRGLGSSVTLRLGVAAALNQLSGQPLGRADLFALVSALEGHPDNAAPAVWGGFTVAGGDAEPACFPVAPALHFVLLVPDFEVRTQQARQVLPASVDRRAAVASAARACRITAAFAAQRYEGLRGAFVDEAFHQPHRLGLVPFLPDVVRAAEEAGALGGFLSGSGSTVACLTLAQPAAVGAAMRAAAGPDQAGARVVVCGADNDGYQVTA